MKTWYLMEEIRTYISEEENTESSRSTIKRRVPSVDSVEAETWQEAKEKFKDLTQASKGLI